jgi:hypothetical protein
VVALSDREEKVDDLVWEMLGYQIECLIVTYDDQLDSNALIS